MSVETTPGAATRAIIRLRGYYALLAGALLLFVVPLYQLTVLAPTGYTDALAPAADHRDFAPLLAWLVNHLCRQSRLPPPAARAVLAGPDLPTRCRAAHWHDK